MLQFDSEIVTSKTDVVNCKFFKSPLCSENLPLSVSLSLGDKDGSKVTTVVATPGQGPDRPQEVSYTDTKVIGNGSFGVVYQAKLCDSGELVAIKKVLQDKRFKVKHAHTISSIFQITQPSHLSGINRKKIKRRKQHVQYK